MRNLALASILCIGLAGCATAPQDFQQHMNNAVDNVGIVGDGAVSIATEIAKAVLAIAQPVTSIFNFAINLESVL